VSIALWRRRAPTILGVLVCSAPVLVSAAQCGQEKIPQTPAGLAFERACEAREAKHYSEAVRSFQLAARLAHDARDLHWEAKARTWESASQLHLFQYSAALESSELAAALARQAHEPMLSGAANGNIAMIYAHLGNFALARQKLGEAISDLQKSDRKDLLANAYLVLSYHQIRLGDTQAGVRSSDLAIQVGRDTKNTQLEAKAWDLRGAAFILAHRTSDAERSLTQAVDLFKSAGAPTPAITLEHLAELKWQQHQSQAALSFIDQAFSTADSSFKASPQYYPLTVRAGILRDLGRTDEALTAYRKALMSADTWRRAALPGDTTNIETVRELNDTYQSFAELAAQQSLARHDESLAREAFEALAQNRAASLREQLAREMGQSSTLPAEYLAKLGELQTVQARITLSEDAAAQSRLAELETEIAELETQIGLRAEKKPIYGEKNPVRNSLRDIQTGLGPTEALFSFCLGEREAFLWAVTTETMRLYQLPSPKAIGADTSHLRDAVEHGRDFAGPARTLGNDLFAQVDPKFRTKTHWLVVGDGALLDRVPFAVLNLGSASLFQEHAVRLLPSELLVLNRSAAPAETRFLGIADPLYNLADSRAPRQAMLRNTKASSALGRLPGSQREVRTSAKSSGLPESELLIGPDANLEALTAALSKRPTIVHFAVHVVSPPGHPEQAALALSLGPDRIPQLLTREKIASLRVPGSLVVLSGCASAQGQAVPSAGLVGLSRAWLLAGASAVLVSNWPTPDDSGQFFAIFYSYLTRSSRANSGSLSERASDALQKTQLEIQRRGGYGSSPAFWAAYSVVSKE
jgi:CHAT domain-containing protein